MSKSPAERLDDLNEAELLDRASKLAGSKTLEFLQIVDRSQFSLRSWLAAYEIFATWLKHQGRPTDFTIMLGYLACCAKAVEGKCYPLDLKDITLEMLETHGFQG